jgi:small subunit ribosomal protein S17|tara:strand:- start:8849 stop:9175 length:327 start_codon:yes stop_codon:yes gene_type:complete
MKDIGIDVKQPGSECNDSNCPFHGTLKVRGQIIEGTVSNEKMKGTVVVSRNYYRYLKKYERSEKRRSRIKAHNPGCINAKVGDTVRIMECRPLSRVTNFVVIEITEGV